MVFSFSGGKILQPGEKEKKLQKIPSCHIRREKKSKVAIFRE
jgi:hypothetical protein